ncbi:MAG: alpha/beta fold hydrolase [Proteobacteria bacterium]|nr:alpha/beta fold hydrolase [Pseudomonadota bacterium]MBU1738713.1 alpha/beta fold hydrolase [Pseudomonadota bacterium]
MSIPAEPRQIRVYGHNLTYYRAGRGSTVLLVHGITTYSFIWRNIFPSLAEHYDVIAVDLLGCGQRICENDRQADRGGHQNQSCAGRLARQFHGRRRKA